jgi:hypothetical protein
MAKEELDRILTISARVTRWEEEESPSYEIKALEGEYEAAFRGASRADRRSQPEEQ